MRVVDVDFLKSAFKPDMGVISHESRFDHDTGRYPCLPEWVWQDMGYDGLCNSTQGEVAVYPGPGWVGAENGVYLVVSVLFPIGDVERLSPINDIQCDHNRFHSNFGLVPLVEGKTRSVDNSENDDCKKDCLHSLSIPCAGGRSQ